MASRFFTAKREERTHQRCFCSTVFRLALRHPERVTGLIVQNGNAYEEGLSPFWDQLKAYWATNSQEARDALRPLMSLEVTKFQYLDGVSDQTRTDPSNWLYDQQFLDRPGNIEIQLDLFYDYQNNVALYPKFPQFFRDRQPPTLIVWGKNDVIFPAPGAEAFKRDLPKGSTSSTVDTLLLRIGLTRLSP